MKRIIRVLIVTAPIVIVLASLVHPSGPVKAAKSDQLLLAGADIDPAVLQLLERSCQNCHSEKTEWPWYSHIAPMSWLTESDVAQARSHMNLSRWDEYAIDEKQDALGHIAAIIRSGEMPPARYTAVQASAKLTSTDRERIYEWAHAERRRLRSIPPTSVGTGF